MTEEDKIKKIFYDYEDGGLVSKDIKKVLRCLSDRIVGIGIGEQGFVTSKADVVRVFQAGLKDQDNVHYSIFYDRIEILFHNDQYATLCAKITIIAKEAEKISKSHFLQSLNFIKESDEWKICSLHASTAEVTEETIHAYPLKFAEKTLESLKERIGEQVYRQEEQYRKAILADMIAFYIINFTKNEFETSQVNSELCANVEPGTPFEPFILSQLPYYILEEDQEGYRQTFRLCSIQKAFESQESEISCEYRLKRPDGAFLWVVTIIRLFTDTDTSEQKGILYVKDIDKQKRKEQELQNKSERDEMTGLLRKGAMIRSVERILSSLDPAPGKPQCLFLMLDVDNFKQINDTYGHPTGDLVLIEVAKLLQNTFWPDSIIGRLGGDEFGIFSCCQHLTRQAVEDVVCVLKQKFFRFKMPGAENQKIPLSCSFGIVLSRDSASFKQLYKQADSALYESKKNGKNQYSFYTDNQE